MICSARDFVGPRVSPLQCTCGVQGCWLGVGRRMHGRCRCGIVITTREAPVLVPPESRDDNLRARINQDHCKVHLRLSNWRDGNGAPSKWFACYTLSCCCCRRRRRRQPPEFPEGRVSIGWPLAQKDLRPANNLILC